MSLAVLYNTRKLILGVFIVYVS